MPNVSQTIRIRREQRARQQRCPWQRLGLVSGILISLTLVVLSLLGVWRYIDLTQGLPSVDTLVSLLEPPNSILLQPTRLYDRTREHVILTLETPTSIGKQYLYIGNNSPAGANQAPQILIDATIAEFDPQFWHHPGFSLAGIVEGNHPTLAQQLISDLVLVDESPSLRRNIRERLLAAQVTAKYGREKVLEWYINNVQYGELVYGADAAARVYFGKPAMELSLAEAAMLTSIARMSAGDFPSDYPGLKQLQELIIQKLLVEGSVTSDTARQALKEDIHLIDYVNPQSIAPAYTQLVLTQLGSVLPLERVRRGGFDIITNLDYGLQSQAECTTAIQLARIKGAEPPTATMDGNPCEASNLLPTLQTGADQNLEDMQAEVIVLDPHSGQVLALVGEVSPGTTAASQITHPTGSILNPFLYLTAFTQGMSPSTLLWDLPVKTQNTDLNTDPSNLTEQLLTSYHGPVSLRKAFSNDYRGAVSEVLTQVGIENVLLTETQFGIGTSGSESFPGATLDDLYSQPASLLESVQAYSILANLGVMSGQPVTAIAHDDVNSAMSYTSILQVVDRAGKIWVDWSHPRELPVVSPQIAYLVSNILSDEKVRWPSLGHPNAIEIGRPAAAKVSLTEAGYDAWAVGYIPQLAVGAWMGHSEAGVSGVSVEMAAGIWHALMQYASTEMPVQEFNVPTGISRVQVCDPSGKLVTPSCQTVVQEVFLAGNEPTQADDLYQKIFVNRQTGKLATIFTPSEFVDEKVYLVIPPEAADWANAVGLPVPPQTYDDIDPATSSSTAARLSSPTMFENVRGQLSLLGSAGGEGFDYYRLQVGQGLYPQEWIQIVEDVHQPVSDGYLGTWDTSSLDGLYVIELLVVKQDKRIERALISVMIDNTTPKVQILFPNASQQFSALSNPIIIINSSISDNQAVLNVEFYVDNELIFTLYDPPWIVLWTAQPGMHTLRVRAYDLAGNVTEASTAFSINK